jgi:hypothetical protein
LSFSPISISFFSETLSQGFGTQESQTKILNPKLETLPPKADPLFAENAKQTQMSKTPNSKLHNLLSFRLWVCFDLEFSVLSLSHYR